MFDKNVICISLAHNINDEDSLQFMTLKSRGKTHRDSNAKLNKNPQSYHHFPFQLNNSLKCDVLWNVNEFLSLWWWSYQLKVCKDFNFNESRRSLLLRLLLLSIILTFSRSSNYEKWLNKLFTIRAAITHCSISPSVRCISIYHLPQFNFMQFWNGFEKWTSHAEIFIINFFYA